MIILLFYVLTLLDQIKKNKNVSVNIYFDYWCMFQLY